MSAVATGRRAEEIAQRYLAKKGYLLLARNYRAGHQELDLVMRDGAAVVFVEVKARASFAHGLPCEAIGPRKRRNLSVAATAFLMERGWSDCPARFDVVELDLARGLVRHTQNAFMADL